MKSGVVGNIIVHQQVTGHYDAALARQHVDQCRAVVDRYGKLIVFCDWQGMESYASESRIMMTEAATSYGSKLINYHVLAGATFVRMGVAVASVVVPVIRAYKARPEFVIAYQRVLREQGIVEQA